MEEISKRLDHLETDLTDSMKQVARSQFELSRNLADQEVTVYELQAIMKQHSRDIRAMRTDMKTLQASITTLKEEVKAGFAEVLEAIRKQREP